MSEKMSDHGRKDASWQNVAYIQLDAIGSLIAIPEAGIKALDIVVLAFADPTNPEINPAHLKAMQDIINKEKTGAINLLSIGGETVLSIPDPAKAVSNICSQITEYNAKLQNGEIVGVDLDLENSIDTATITTLAQGFKEKGYIVSAAPQVFTGGGDIDSRSPVNLVLTSGGTQAIKDTYGIAIKYGYIDYIFAQTYNSGGFKVDGYEENDVNFFHVIAKALNNLARIKHFPSHTKIMIGEPANQGAGGAYTIFNPCAMPPVYEYDQAAILAELLELVNSIKKDPHSFSRISGVMMWSSNNDYMPEAWRDTYAKPGAFSKVIFDAKE